MLFHQIEDFQTHYPEWIFYDVSNLKAEKEFDEFYVVNVYGNEKTAQLIFRNGTNEDYFQQVLLKHKHGFDLTYSGLILLHNGCIRCIPDGGSLDFFQSLLNNIDASHGIPILNVPNQKKREATRMLDEPNKRAATEVVTISSLLNDIERWNTKEFNEMEDISGQLLRRNYQSFTDKTDPLFVKTIISLYIFGLLANARSANKRSDGKNCMMKHFVEMGNLDQKKQKKLYGDLPSAKTYIGFIESGLSFDDLPNKSIAIEIGRHTGRTDGTSRTLRKWKGKDFTVERIPSFYKEMLRHFNGKKPTFQECKKYTKEHISGSSCGTGGKAKATN